MAPIEKERRVTFSDPITVADKDTWAGLRCIGIDTWWPRVTREPRLKFPPSEPTIFDRQVVSGYISRTSDHYVKRFLDRPLVGFPLNRFRELLDFLADDAKSLVLSFSESWVL